MSENQNRLEAAAGRYRPDIDGLRAVAVLPVVLFHFRVAPFGGGFVGVDIFFVISGFLITALICGEMQQGRFSILGFYERRVRRILPALFAVMAFTAVASAILLFPDALVAFAKSLIATAAFVSNFQFWSEAGYFDLGAPQKPLLHTWSLAVEEQFYLIFPALLWLLRKARERTLLIVLAALAAISFAASVCAVQVWPVSAFYLLPFRFWELALGGVLAVGKFAVPQNAWVRNAISLAGLGLIGWSIFTLNSASPFPGLNALPPCLGAALLIYSGSGRNTAINGALGTRVPVFIGLISYSLYLWHWPLYVFARALSPGSLSSAVTVALIALSFVLAYLSWRFVEQPFRGRASFIKRGPLFAAAAIAMLVLAGAGGAFWSGNGYPLRYGPEIRQILAAGNDREPQLKHCFNLAPEKIARRGLCAIGKAGGKASFLLWGDSHADAILPAVARAAAAAGKTGLFAARGSCPPLVGVERLDERECAPFNRAVLPIAMRANIKLVFLDARWAEATGAPAFGPDDSGKVVLADRGDRANTATVFARSLERTVDRLTRAGKRVVLIGPVPEMRWSVPNELAKMKLLGGNWTIGSTQADFLSRQAIVMHAFADMQTRHGVTIVWLHQALCARGMCRAVLNGRPLYRDSQHLTATEAEHLSGLFVTLF